MTLYPKTTIMFLKETVMCGSNRSYIKIKRSERLFSELQLTLALYLYAREGTLDSTTGGGYIKEPCVLGEPQSFLHFSSYRFLKEI